MNDETDELERYRLAARAWLDGNMERRTASRRALPRTGTRSADDIAHNRRLQRKVFDGGYAGITFPTEFGGQGLSAAHERVFREEAASFVMPDLGGAGGMTMGP